MALLAQATETAARCSGNAVADAAHNRHERLRRARISAVVRHVTLTCIIDCGSHSCLALPCTLICANDAHFGEQRRAGRVCDCWMVYCHGSSYCSVADPSPCPDRHGKGTFLI